MLSTLYSKQPQPPAPTHVRAGYDAARTTVENSKHWGQVDYLAPVSQLTPQVRKTLRARSRYETQNNCYARGLVATLAGDVVGTGPRLQVLTQDEGFNAAVEEAWDLWAKVVNLPDTLRILDESRRRDGECFALFRDNPKLLARGSDVTLDLRLVEADQVADPFGWSPLGRPTGDDGIVCDADGDPVTYKVLKAHPGDERRFAEKFEAIDVPAANVLHWFRTDRPGQLRGVPELAPALPLFAQLRRYTLATLTAAEIAAMLAGVLQSELPVPQNEDGSAVISATPFESVEMVRGMLLTLPPGYSASQFKAEQPTTGYAQFVNAILREIGRCLDVPYGLVAGDSSGYNYSSARLDHQTYDLRRDFDRRQLAARILDPILFRFLEEAALAIPRLTAYRGRLRMLPHAWYHDARPSIDPVKDATADDMRLANGTTDLAEVCAAEGKDWKQVLATRAKVLAEYDRLGMPRPAWSLGTAPVAAAPAPAPEEEKQVANAA